MSTWSISLCIIDYAYSSLMQYKMLFSSVSPPQQIKPYLKSAWNVHIWNFKLSFRLCDVADVALLSSDNGITGDLKSRVKNWACQCHRKNWPDFSAYKKPGRQSKGTREFEVEWFMKLTTRWMVCRGIS